MNIGAQQGRVANSPEIRLSARTEFPDSSDIWIQNLALTNTNVRESPCATNSTFQNLARTNSTLNVCP